jgi:hypothetical protein
MSMLSFYNFGFIVEGSMHEESVISDGSILVALASFMNACIDQTTEFSLVINDLLINDD